MNILNNLKNKILGNHSDPKINSKCTEFEVNNWIISEFIIKKLIKISGIHPFPLTELHLMTSALCYLKPDLIFEWGTNIGKSARIFHEIAKFFKINTSIQSIDLPDYVAHNEHPQSKRGYLVRGIKNVDLHQGDGVSLAIKLYQPDLHKRVLVFIDGDHSYKSVKNELNQIYKSIPKAWILLHDTFYQSPESQYNIGPSVAIQEFLTEHPGLYRLKSTDLGLPGMTLLYK